MLKIDDTTVAAVVTDICRFAQTCGGRALVVGGAVRDSASGQAVSDIDIEIFGVAPERVKGELGARYRLDLVGDAFGVLKLHGLNIDVSIPRRESKAGLGHKGFDILSDPRLSVKEAALRRDFTINAMSVDPLTGELFDYYGGMADLEARVLRHTSGKFTEDPLRVLRGMQFAARFDLCVAPETVVLCRSMDMHGLARERVFAEWGKLVQRGGVPSRGLVFLKACGWLRFFPELARLVGCQQEPDWHPEGDVWAHTLHCMDAFAKERLNDPVEDLVVGMAVLCHDFGKPLTTTFERGRIRSLGHEEAGAEPTRSFLSGMTNQSDFIRDVIALVVNHLKPVQLFEAEAGDSAVRRLAVRTGRIDRLVRVARADQQGRPPCPFDGFPAGAWLLQRAHALDVAAAVPKPLVQGRHLIALGMAPSPLFGHILSQCYEAQIEGRIRSEEEGVRLALALTQKKESQLC